MCRIGSQGKRMDDYWILCCVGVLVYVKGHFPSSVLWIMLLYVNFKDAVGGSSYLMLSKVKSTFWKQKL